VNDVPLENISINFSADSLVLLNICLGFIMFGIALGIDPKQFRSVVKSPKGVITGAISQFLVLPFITFLLILLLKPHPALSMGMLLVASCPGGNISNYISSISGANVALSVSLTGVATLLTPIFTPLNFGFWAGAIPETSALLKSFDIDFYRMVKTVVLILALPLLSGMFIKSRFTTFASKIEKPIRIISFIILLSFIAVALSKNFTVFKNYIHWVVLLVLAHNFLAFVTGYLLAKAARLPEADKRTVSIETGIQNSGLGLVIIFTFFGGNGGMALVAAWWGIWHIAAGLILSRVFAWSDRRRAKV
jgi:BASS family bile acid:Na+ symporter